MRVRVLAAALLSVVVFGISGQAMPAATMQATVDVTTFITAFESGAAKKYVGSIVRGSGQNFHGLSAAPLQPGQPRQYAQTVTLGAMTSAHKIVPITTKDQFLAAERDEHTIAIWLTGPAVPRGATTDLPQPISFIGMYAGHGKWMARTQPHEQFERSNPGDVCVGEPPLAMGQVGNQQMIVRSFYCVPVLENAQVKK
jgi:hypothetical protein